MRKLTKSQSAEHSETSQTSQHHFKFRYNYYLTTEYRDVPDPHFYRIHIFTGFRIQEFTGSLIRIPDSEPDSGSGF